MMGTFASVLATREIRTHTDRFEAHVEGDIEDVDGVLRITVIRVHYLLKLRAREEEDARWAMARYIENCPAAMSVRGCIRIEDSIDFSYD